MVHKQLVALAFIARISSASCQAVNYKQIPEENTCSITAASQGLQIENLTLYEKGKKNSMLSIIKKPFYYIRHGQTDWNEANVVMGSTDIPLNERGLEQARQAAELLRDTEIASIAVSPLSRAVQTAEIIAQAIQKPITIIDNLRECSVGIIEGKSKGEVGKAFQEWLNGGIIEGAELFADFTLRVFSGLKQAIELPGPVLVVAHGGVYRTLQKSLGLPTQGLPNCIPVYHEPSDDLMSSWIIRDVNNDV